MCYSTKSERIVLEGGGAPPQPSGYISQDNFSLLLFPRTVDEVEEASDVAQSWTAELKSNLGIGTHFIQSFF